MTNEQIWSNAISKTSILKHLVSNNCGPKQPQPTPETIEKYRHDDNKDRSGHIDSNLLKRYSKNIFG